MASVLVQVSIVMEIYNVLMVRMKHTVNASPINLSVTRQGNVWVQDCYVTALATVQMLAMRKFVVSSY